MNFDMTIVMSVTLSPLLSIDFHVAQAFVYNVDGDHELPDRVRFTSLYSATTELSVYAQRENRK